MLKAPQSRQGRKMLFNPTDVREKVKGPIGLEHHLSWELDESAQNSALSQSASFMLSEAIRGLMVGYVAASRELLGKAKIWLEQAIETGEKPGYYFHGGTEAQRHGELALCNWFLTGEHDQQNMDRFLEWKQVYYSEDGKDKVDVSLGIVSYIDSLDYEATRPLA